MNNRLKRIIVGLKNAVGELWIEFGDGIGNLLEDFKTNRSKLFAMLSKKEPQIHLLNLYYEPPINEQKHNKNKKKYHRQTPKMNETKYNQKNLKEETGRHIK